MKFLELWFIVWVETFILDTNSQMWERISSYLVFLVIHKVKAVIFFPHEISGGVGLAAGNQMTV